MRTSNKIFALLFVLAAYQNWAVAGIESSVHDGLSLIRRIETQSHTGISRLDEFRKIQDPRSHRVFLAFHYGPMINETTKDIILGDMREALRENGQDGWVFVDLLKDSVGRTIGLVFDIDVSLIPSKTPDEELFWLIKDLLRRTEHLVTPSACTTSLLQAIPNPIPHNFN